MSEKSDIEMAVVENGYIISVNGATYVFSDLPSATKWMSENMGSIKDSKSLVDRHKSVTPEEYTKYWPIVDNNKQYDVVPYNIPAGQPYWSAAPYTTSNITYGTIPKEQYNVASVADLSDLMDSVAKDIKNGIDNEILKGIYEQHK